MGNNLISEMSTWFKVTFLLFNVTLLFFIPYCESMSCSASAKTAMKVSRCPKNQLEWMIEAEKVNCSSIEQPCVKADDFVYHCVLNTKLTRFIQVCAPAKSIMGKMCAEYNAGGKVIQESLDARCGMDRIPCPSIYPSTEAYKYQECYDSIRHIKNKTDNINLHSTNCPEEITCDMEVHVLVVFTVLLVCLNAGTCTCLWIFRPRNGYCWNAYKSCGLSEKGIQGANEMTETHPCR